MTYEELVERMARQINPHEWARYDHAIERDGYCYNTKILGSILKTKKQAKAAFQVVRDAGLTDA